MYLKQRISGDLVEIEVLDSLIDPCRDRISGRLHAGEEIQEPQAFLKQDLIFPSNEALPRCWLDPHYRQH